METDPNAWPRMPDEVENLRLRLTGSWYWRQNEVHRFVEVEEMAAALSVPASEWLGLERWNCPNSMPESFWREHRSELQARRPFSDLQYEMVVVGNLSETRWLQVSGEPVYDAQGEFRGYHGFGRDVTSHKRMEIALRSREQRLRSIFDQSPLAIIEWDTHLRVRRWNLAAERIFGWSHEEILGRHARVLSHPSRHHLYDEMGLDIAPASAPRKHVTQNMHKLGHEVPCAWVTSLLHDEQGKVVGGLSIVENLTEKKVAQSLIDHMTRHDSLTNLPNRAHLLEMLEERLNSGLSGADAEVAVVVMNVDRFKQINEALGHVVGDQVLHMLAQRLRQACPSTSVVARLEGDEFAVVLLKNGTASTAHALGEKLRSDLALPYVVNEQEVNISVSIGLAVFPNDGADARELMHNANAALSYAKQSGRNQLRFFSASLGQAVIARHELERDLRLALRRNELLLHFQPQLDAVSGAMVGAEALLRWNHPSNGLVAPVTFVPIAESTDLIVEMGAWVLNQACRTLKEWHDMGVNGVTMSVNLSAHQLRDAALVDLVANALKQHGLSGPDLELELTESAAMADPRATIEVLHRLRQLQVRLAIDDFGTGHSSLSYLKLLPIQRVKLDQSFVREIETNENDAAICSAIIALAHKLKLEVVAEGVSTELQRNYLLSSGCDVLQGYLFSKPVATDDAVQFALQHARRHSGFGTSKW